MMLPAQARIVIVGGGAVGCSIAYHLAQLGVKDVLLLERSTLTSGCTWHAAGLVGQLRSKSNLTRMMQMSAQLYARIGEETGQDVGWHGTGSLRLASSANRWLELKRSATIAQSIGFEMHLLTPKEAFDHFPLIDPEGVVGAAFVPSDGYVDPYGLTHAYAKGARAGGVRIVEGVSVTGVVRQGARITAVQVAHDGVASEVGCEIIVNAAGLWARQFGELAGLELPVTVVEHQYLVTEKTGRIPSGLPSLRDPDNNFYLKPEPGAFAIGGWEEGTVAPFGDGRLPLDFGQQLFQQNLDRLERFVVPAATRLPLLNELGIRTVINGPIPVSADGEPIIGRHPDLDNYYLACGFTAGIAGSGGAGKVLAQWIVDGDPGMDLWAFDVRRFSQHHASPAYLHDVGIETYAAYYKIAWPNEERVAARGARRSPLYDKLLAAGAVYGSKNGWERPNWFRRDGTGETGNPSPESFDRLIWNDTVGAEHRLVRNSVALIDMTSFTKFEVTGPGAFTYLNWLAAANLDQPVGTAVYTQLCNEKGGIEADLTIVQLAVDRFYVVTGSGFGTRDGGWIRAHAPGDGSVRVDDVTSSRAVINLCGPLARDVLRKVTTDDVSNAGHPYMRAKNIRIGLAPALAVRITYVGELGWELHIPTDYAAYVYDRLLDAGREFGIGHAGYRAIDSLRMEKGYVYWSADVTPDYNPFEAGLGFAVALRKGEFNGRNALVRIKAQGVARKLCTFVLDDALPVYGGESILCDGVVIGNTTSGNYGFTVGKSIVYGYVPIAHASATSFVIEAFGERSAATRIDGPAYDPQRINILR